MSDEHKCLNNSGNIIFYSKLWKSLALKIYPANYDQIPDDMKLLPVFKIVMITIEYCPYCGKHKEDMEEFTGGGI